MANAILNFHFDFLTPSLIDTLILLYIQVFAESPFKITNGSVTATSLLSKVGNTPKKTNMAKDKQTKKIKTTKCQKSLKISTSPDFLLNNSVAFREPQIFAQPERVEGQLVKDLSEVLSMLKEDLSEIFGGI